jgi:hypothetical protein
VIFKSITAGHSARGGWGVRAVRLLNAIQWQGWVESAGLSSH